MCEANIFLATTRKCVRQVYFWQQLDNILKSILGNNQGMFEASILFGNKQKIKSAKMKKVA